MERPFKATFTGATTDIVFAPGFDFVTNPTATSTFNGRCPGGASWLISFSGSGDGTHLGELTWASSHCSLVTSLSPPNVAVSSGRLRFVAANGDELNENYVGVDGLFAAGDQLCVNTAATFAGETGRFTDASGSAMELGCWPASIQGPVIHDLVIKSAGTITFDAGQRSRSARRSHMAQARNRPLMPLSVVHADERASCMRRDGPAGREGPKLVLASAELNGLIKRRTRCHSASDLESPQCTHVSEPCSSRCSHSAAA